MPLKKRDRTKTKTPAATGGFFLANAPKNLISLKDLSREQIEKILITAEGFKRQINLPDKKSDHLKGKTVISLFFEPSTRTRTSFELAARRLSADLISVAPQSSSLTKGESLKDMVENLEAMGPDILIVRHEASGVPGLIAAHTKAAVINAGDGSHEHPTQGLLDLLTVREHLGKIEGLHLIIVGDIAYSRVARSNIYGFRKLGARVTCVGPATLIPPGIERMGGHIAHDLDKILPDADVVMLLRIQKERQEKLNFPSIAEYSRFFCLTKERVSRMREKSLIMHPGPINRGIEIDTEVADRRLADGENGPKTVILDQVTNGLAVRMAVLSLWGQGRKN